jgi:hypothetical protein
MKQLYEDWANDVLTTCHYLMYEDSNVIKTDTAIVDET